MPVLIEIPHHCYILYFRPNNYIIKPVPISLTCSSDWETRTKICSLCDERENVEVDDKKIKKISTWFDLMDRPFYSIILLSQCQFLSCVLCPVVNSFHYFHLKYKSTFFKTFFGRNLINVCQNEIFFMFTARLIHSIDNP